MNLIIPMAGKGKRLRPHTLTTLKPLMPIAGKPIIQRLVEDIAKMVPDKIDVIGFVVGNLENDVKKHLKEIANKAGAEERFYRQETAEGTAHAVACAYEMLKGKVIIAFADTLFRACFTLNSDNDGIIWTKRVKDPSAFGVVKTNAEGVITNFIEKPQEFISDQAIIGIYYFKKGEALWHEIDHLIKNNIRGGGEFQLTMALERLKKKGIIFKTGIVDEWLDCGHKNAMVQSNCRYLQFLKGHSMIHPSVRLENCKILEPVFIGENTVVKNSKIGPNVSIGTNCDIYDVEISNSLIQNYTRLEDVNFLNSLIGNFVKLKGTPKSVSLGDYNDW